MPVGPEQLGWVSPEAPPNKEYLRSTEFGSVLDEHWNWLWRRDIEELGVGEPGPPGPQGPQGATGPQGPAGPQGAAGPQGPAGAAGSKWLSGSGAPSAGLGADGDFYLDTATGRAYAKASGTWTQQVDLLNAWLTGSGAPAGALGDTGDYYLDTAAGDVYRKTGASTWTLQGNIRGPQGIQGIQGIQGPQGPTGQAEAWYSGSGVPAGATGAVGDWYLDTVSGDVYEKTAASTWTLRGNLKGPTGPTGAQGIQGVPGTPGSKWLSGGTAPSAGLGVDGDWYINTSNGRIYQKQSGSWVASGDLLNKWWDSTSNPTAGQGDDGDYWLNTTTGDVLTKITGSWTTTGNIKGPQGIQGIQGIQGPQGPAGTRTIVTTLPASPAVGDEVLYRVGSGTTAFLWGFRYTNNDTTYPWEFTGGPPLVTATTVAESSTSGTHTAYQNLADGAVAVTAPLAGVYDNLFGAYASNPTANTAYISLKYGAAEAGDGDGMLATFAAGTFVAIRHQAPPITVTAAATAVTMRQLRSPLSCDHPSAGEGVTGRQATSMTSLA
jgi:hypothetical protein